jgi:hypothetical protein
MSVIRILHNRENPYVTLNKQPLFDDRLSLKAKGLWAQCLARPDNWRFYVQEMVKNCKEGRRAIYSAIDELIKYNYAIRLEHYQKSENGKFSAGGVEYVFFEFCPTDVEKEELTEEFKKSFRQCGFGNARNGDRRNVQLPNKEPNQSLKTTKKEPPPTPPTEDPKTKEDWRRFFSNWKEEEFEFVWKEFEKAPKGSIKSMNSWFNRVRLRFTQIVESKAASDKIQNSRKYLAKSWEGKKWRGDRVTACKDWVEFTDGSYYKAVRYDVPSEEWVKETGWTE